MPIVGYLKTSEPGRISSITSLDGDMTRRKRLYPIIPGKLSHDPLISMYVLDCPTHEPGGAVLPVVLKQRVSSGGWKEIGIAKCCPICWRILQPPVGIELPPVMEQIAPVISSNASSTTSNETPRHKNPKKPLDGFKVQQMILGYFETADDADVYEIMGLLKCSRQTALKHLDRLIKQKKIIKLASVGGGGNRSLYKLP